MIETITATVIGKYLGSKFKNVDLKFNNDKKSISYKEDSIKGINKSVIPNYVAGIKGNRIIVIDIRNTPCELVDMIDSKCNKDKKNKIFEEIVNSSNNPVNNKRDVMFSNEAIRKFN